MGDLFCDCSLPCCDSQREQTLAATLVVAAPSFLPHSLCSLALPVLPSVDGRVLSLLTHACLGLFAAVSSPHPIFPAILEAVNDCLLCSLDHLFPQNPQSCPDMVPFFVFPRQRKYTHGPWALEVNCICLLLCFCGSGT